MAGIDYEDLEERLLHLVQQGNKSAFPLWARLVMAETDEDRAEVVADLRQHITEQWQRFKELLGE